MKSLIQFGFILLVFYYLYNKDEIQKKSNVSIQENPHQVEKTENKDYIIIRKLGNVDNSDVKEAIDIIKDFYGYNCIVKSGFNITNEMKIKGSDDILNAEKILSEVGYQNKTLFLVDKRIWHNGQMLRGFTDRSTTVVRGEKSFLRETIIHELGHTLGLTHCDDKTCIMALDNDEYDSGTFCEKCSNKIGFHKK
jgi:predicted Zn-dependent protease